MNRRLVITADDLGVDAETNATIVELMRDGLVSATTLIPVATAATDAVERLKAAGLHAPRLHLTLNSAREWAGWSPLSADARTLIGPDGTLPLDAAQAERSASTADVAREMFAQLGWMRRLGLRPPALDSHSGTLYGLRGRSLALTAVEFCAEHGLAFRLPRRLASVLGLAVRGLGTAHRRAVRRADALGVRLPQTLVGSWLPGSAILGYGHLRADVLAQLRSLPRGTSELIVHPSPLASAQRFPAGEGRKRLWELRLLRDPAFHRALRREHIEVVPAW
ncbi:ChbG/HpnK family deacetylase [Georgenia wutianyii]|uniref:ChbG/HpnK family deacetylase n=1 Tax=Georgenia wutianyii TaxID=2585135 RepID=A0ABX5VJB3_9MICO|nr:ChbG/HpnK family deacetylase [Georgenia wutianyii]QDB78499.1 ChbG/HpnK family deacetylase [Georgenia wutianyii]